MFSRVVVAPALLALFFGLTAFFSVPAAGAEIELPKGPSRSLVYAKCRTCHDLQYVIESKGLTPDAWDGLLDDMEGFGVELSKQERARILTYLSAYMSTNPPPAQVGGSEQKTLNGSRIFAENCTSCHRKDAKGIEETFPPLAENADLFLSKDFPAVVLLNGMSGTIIVKGASYEGDMPPFTHLSDGEIAALVNFLRGNFGNGANRNGVPDLSAAEVGILRTRRQSPEQVLSYRKSLIK